MDDYEVVGIVDPSELTDEEFDNLEIRFVNNDPTGAFVVTSWVIQRGLVSFRALGLHVYCRSRAFTEGPGFTVSGIQLADEYGHEGRWAIQAAINELIAVGLMMRRRVRGKDGRFRTVTLSFDWPWNERPDLPVTHEEFSGQKFGPVSRARA